MASKVGPKVLKHIIKSNSKSGIFSPPQDPLFNWTADGKRGKKHTKKTLQKMLPFLTEQELDVLWKVIKRSHRLDTALFGKLGWGFVFGLVPVAGDFADAILSIWVVNSARSVGHLPSSIQVRMMRNVLIEAILGFVPLLGDVLNGTYKCDIRNAAMLNDYLKARNEELAFAHNDELASSLQRDMDENAANGGAWGILPARQRQRSGSRGSRKGGYRLDNANRNGNGIGNTRHEQAQQHVLDAPLSRRNSRGSRRDYTTSTTDNHHAPQSQAMPAVPGGGSTRREPHVERGRDGAGVLSDHPSKPNEELTEPISNGKTKQKKDGWFSRMASVGAAMREKEGQDAVSMAAKPEMREV
ncbi:hypothetical protein MMC25_002652 [Agyrium rufum]|nr:hypothetical protein [Agyrium rufum]